MSYSNIIQASDYYSPHSHHSARNTKAALSFKAISEPETCSYTLTICTPIMCKNPYIPVSDEEDGDVINAGGKTQSLLSFLRSPTCVLRQESWWTYELCLNASVRQIRYN